MSAFRDLVKRKFAEHDKLWSFFTALLDFYYLIREKEWVTACVGPIYERSRDVIEIDITYACNLLCYGCNRSCALAPSSDSIKLDQIRKFLQETVNKGIIWRRIALMGGEPTLHPHFLEILNELYVFKKRQGVNTTIAVVTNGFNNKLPLLPSYLESEIVIESSAKRSRVQYFKPFNLAPCDFPRYRNFNFSRGCGTLVCGIGLSPYGYYQCPVAASIDRVMGFDIARKSLPDTSDAMRDQMKTLCRYCGHFTTFNWIVMDREIMSESWSNAYKQYRIMPPDITYY